MEDGYGFKWEEIDNDFEEREMKEKLKREMKV